MNQETIMKYVYKYKFFWIVIIAEIIYKLMGTVGMFLYGAILIGSIFYLFFKKHDKTLQVLMFLPAMRIIAGVVHFNPNITLIITNLLMLVMVVTYLKYHPLPVGRINHKVLPFGIIAGFALGYLLTRFSVPEYAWYLMVFVPIIEETYFRGLLQGMSKSYILPAILYALFFGTSVLFFIVVLILNLLIGLLYERTDNLVLVILMRVVMGAAMVVF